MFRIDNLKEEIEAVKKLSKEEGDFSHADSEKVKARIFAEIYQPQAVKEVSYKISFWQLHERTFRYAISVVLSITLVGGTAFASNNSVPGDPLYPIKRLSEKVQLGLAFNQETKIELQEKFAEERIAEIEKLEIPETVVQTGKVELNQEVKKANQEAKIKATAEVQATLESFETIKQNKITSGDEKSAQSINEKIDKLKSKIETRKNKTEKKPEDKIESNKSNSKLKVNGIGNGKNGFKGSLQGEGAVEFKLDENSGNLNITNQNKTDRSLQGSGESKLQNTENYNKFQKTQDKEHFLNFDTDK